MQYDVFTLKHILEIEILHKKIINIFHDRVL